jgi:putative sigma-54 modulation protein
MTIVFTGRRAHLTPALKEFTEAKLGKISRVLDEILDAHVILKVEKHRRLSEIVLKSRTTTLTAKAEGPEFHDSIGQCIERLLAQAKKHRGRMTTRRKGRGVWTEPRRGSRALRENLTGLPGVPADGGPPIVRMGRVPLQPLSLEEAAVKVRDSHDEILVFRETGSRRVAVLFRRPDGQLGLLETEA